MKNNKIRVKYVRTATKWSNGIENLYTKGYNFYYDENGLYRIDREVTKYNDEVFHFFSEVIFSTDPWVKVGTKRTYLKTN